MRDARGGRCVARAPRARSGGRRAAQAQDKQDKPLRREPLGDNATPAPPVLLRDVGPGLCFSKQFSRAVHECRVAQAACTAPLTVPEKDGGAAAFVAQLRAVDPPAPVAHAVPGSDALVVTDADVEDYLDSALGVLVRYWAELAVAVLRLSCRRTGRQRKSSAAAGSSSAKPHRAAGMVDGGRCQGCV